MSDKNFNPFDTRLKIYQFDFLNIFPITSDPLFFGTYHDLKKHLCSNKKNILKKLTRSKWMPNLSKIHMVSIDDHIQNDYKSVSSEIPSILFMGGCLKLVLNDLEKRIFGPSQYYL